MGPSTALTMEGSDGHTFLLGLLALSIVIIVFFHACLVLLVVLIGQAEIRVKHHLTCYTVVNCFPLISIFVVSNS